MKGQGDIVVNEYIVDIVNEFPFSEDVRDKTFFVTGATGFIGSAIVKSLLLLKEGDLPGIKIVVYVRNKDKALSMFGDKVSYIVGDLSSDFEMPRADYVIHCASPTDSKFFISNPIETFMDNINFTRRLAERSLYIGVRSFVYLSSLEVYGTSEKERVLKEDSVSYFHLLNARNSYPLAKIACEELLNMYYEKYALSVKIARLTQTFGPGVDYSDNRVFAQFARCAVENKDIVLKSKGETKRSYCYITDAVNAIFYILFAGKSGEAYNVSGDDTYVSILELAELFRAHNSHIDIKFDIEDNSKTGYLPVNRVNLDNNKLKSLGWRSKYNIGSMVNSLLDCFANKK